MGQHVVVHIDGRAVVDGVTQALSEDGLACVWGKAEQKEACLCRGKAIDRLKEIMREKFIVSTIGVLYHAGGLLFCQKSPHPINLDDLELLSNISWVGRQPGPARDKTKEKHSLLIGELLQALPKPTNKLVALCDVTVSHQLL